MVGLVMLDDWDRCEIAFLDRGQWCVDAHFGEPYDVIFERDECESGDRVARGLRDENDTPHYRSRERAEAIWYRHVLGWRV